MLRPQLAHSRVSTPAPQAFTPANGIGTPSTREDNSINVNSNSNSNINSMNNNIKNKHGFIHPKDYEKPKADKLLNTFSNHLASFIGSVSKFRPSMALAENLVISESELAKAIVELAQHHEAAKRIFELKKQSKALDGELETLLITLSDCRRTLRALPKPDEKFLKQLPEGVLDYTKELVKLTVEDDDEDEDDESMGTDGTDGKSKTKMKKSEYLKKLEELRQQRRKSSLVLNGKIGPEKAKVSARELLDYATRITKFTSAPPGFNPQGGGDFNYPWPSEDELRKGMLALSQMTGIKEIEEGKNANVKSENGKVENGKTNVVKTEPTSSVASTSTSANVTNTSNATIKIPEQEASTSAASQPNNSSSNTAKPSNDSKPAAVEVPEHKPAPTKKLDLDFFDSDEDDL